MEVTVMADTLSLTHHLSLPSPFQISSNIFPIDAISPPPVKSRPSRATATRRSLLKRRRTRRRSSSPESGDDDGGFFNGGGDMFSGGGRGWNFDGFGGGGGFNWDDWSSSSSFPDDPAFDFVYEVVCWIVFSNCLHFAFKKVVRLMVAEEREKVPVRLTSIC